MATYTPVVDVNITINTVTLAQAGFGLPLFVAAHTAFNERVRQYSGPSEVLADFGNDTSAPAYKAALQFYKNTPSPNFIKIGRRSAQWSGTLVGFDSTSGNETTHQIKIEVLDKSESVDLSIAATVGQTEQAYIEAVATQINSSDVGTVNGKGYVTASYQSGTLLITPLKTGATEGEEDLAFTVSTEATATSWNGAYAGFEDAAQTITSLRDYDDDWYFLATHDRSETWVEAMADVIQAANDTVNAGTPSVGKMYFQASGDKKNITGDFGVGTDTSLFGKLRDKNLTRTVSYFHHTAGTESSLSGSTDYPECAYIGYNCVYNAGSVTWSNLRIAGLEASRVSSGGRFLNSNEKNRLAKRNANYSEVDAGVTITRSGVTAGNEWIDIIRGVDWLTSEVETALKRLLFAQQGKRVGYTNQGLTQITEVMQSALQSAVNRGFLQAYDLKVPALSAILSTSTGVTDWQNRVLSDVTFIGYLAGAIQTVSVNGSVQAPTTNVV